MLDIGFPRDNIGHGIRRFCLPLLLLLSILENRKQILRNAPMILMALLVR